MVTFPRDLGDVAMMVGYGDGSGVSSVIVTEEVQGSVQVYPVSIILHCLGARECDVVKVCFHTLFFSVLTAHMRVYLLYAIYTTFATAATM